MSELIDRSFTAQMLRKYAEQKHFNGETELANGILKAMCFIEKEENIPTTTEAEIRAKAIGVMGMAMKEYYPSCKGVYVDFDVFFHAVMAKVAEQMEEGADNGK